MQAQIHPRSRTASTLAAALFFALAGSASAAPSGADVSIVATSEGPELLVLADDGGPNAITLAPSGAGLLVSEAGSKDLIPGTGCVSHSAKQVLCDASGLHHVRAQLGNGSDLLDATRLTLVVWANGEGGDDELAGGTGADILDGGLGDDRLTGGTSAMDVLRGGGGVDAVSYAAHTAAVTADADGQADDGSLGENDTIGADVEAIAGGAGDDEIEAGAGVDTVDAGTGDDHVRTRDGEIDTVACGDGSDELVADPTDVATSCDTVLVPATGPDAPLQMQKLVITLKPGSPIPLAVACAASRTVGCHGTVKLVKTLSVADKAVAARRGRTVVRTTLARSRVRLAAGQSKIIRARASRRGVRQVLGGTASTRVRRKRASVEVSLTNADGTRTTLKRGVTLRIAASR